MFLKKNKNKSINQMFKKMSDIGYGYGLYFKGLSHLLNPQINMKLSSQ